MPSRGSSERTAIQAVTLHELQRHADSSIAVSGVLPRLPTTIPSSTGRRKRSRLTMRDDVAESRSADEPVGEGCIDERGPL